MLIYTINIIKTIGLILLVQLLAISRYSLFTIVVFSCNSVKSQQTNDSTQYDNLTKKYEYTFVEQMPNYKGDDSAFMKDFINCFHCRF